MNNNNLAQFIDAYKSLRNQYLPLRAYELILEYSYGAIRPLIRHHDIFNNLDGMNLELAVSILSEMPEEALEEEDIEVIEFLEIKRVIPEAKFERYRELLEILESDPFFLLKDCISQNRLDMENYINLYNHVIPNSCEVKLTQLGDGFKNQPLNTGNSAVANVDYYGVEITRNPDIDDDGSPDSDAEVYASFRKNFTTFASGEEKDFQFSCNVPFDLDDKADISWKFLPYYDSDEQLWNSDNPLTAIIEIHAWGDVAFSDLVSDDGAIMISSFDTNSWIGSTIQTFRSLTQPFSGNREWGRLRNQNGNLELYARAVDIARVADITLFGPGTNECKEDTYYNIGESTWSNLQKNIAEWVNSLGGEASVIPKTAIRFDKNKLQEILKKNETISTIDCN